MSANDSTCLLRRVLLLDAACSAVMAAGMLTLAGPLAALLALPTGLLSDAGLVLIPFAAFVGVLATRRDPARIGPARFGVWMVIVLNAIWTLNSVVLLLSGWITPNAAGYAFVLAQALAVGVFAELEYVGLRRAVSVGA